MRLWATNAFEKVRLVCGQGCTVWDESGKAYLDLLSGVWANVLGHAHPRWSKAVADQVSKLAHVGAAFCTAEVEEGAAALASVLPPELNRIVFLSGGSEAVELGLKMARAATGRDEIAVIGRGYYGATTYALALSEAGRTAAYLPKFEGVFRLPPPESIESLDQLKGREVAAVVWEPVLGSAGVVVPPLGYGARLRELTRESGALLIAEEVTTGMGRTGRWFGFEHDGVTPDIVTIGKALGAGLPVSAVVTTEEVEAACRGGLRHVHSHQNDPFSGRVAAETIAILKEEKLVERCCARGAYLIERLQEIAARRPAIREVRGKGLMVGVELRPETASHGPGVVERLLEAGFILDYAGGSATFRLFPPYAIEAEELDRFLAAFEEEISRL